MSVSENILFCGSEETVWTLVRVTSINQDEASQGRSSLNLNFASCSLSNRDNAQRLVSVIDKFTNHANNEALVSTWCHADACTLVCM